MTSGELPTWLISLQSAEMMIHIKREASAAASEPARSRLGLTLVELTRNPSELWVTLMDPKIQKILAPARRIRLFREPEPPAGPGPFTLATVELTRNPNGICVPQVDRKIEETSAPT